MLFQKSLELWDDRLVGTNETSSSRKLCSSDSDSKQHIVCWMYFVNDGVQK